MLDDSRHEAEDSGHPKGRVLLMGGLGFIGSHLCRALLREGYDVRIFDKLYGSRELILDIESRIEVLEGDIERPEDVLNAVDGCDLIIDLIHTTVPGSSMQNPAYDIQSNVVSSARWLSLLNKTNVKRVIYVSSGGTVYGIPRTTPIPEEHPTNPLSSYGITKLAIEKYVSMYAELYGIDYRICRPANVYGEGQRLHVGQGVIGVFLSRALAGQPIEIWGDGTSRRDYLYVSDLVSGIIKLIAHNGIGRIFNASTGAGTSLIEIIDAIQQELGTAVEVLHQPSRGFDVPFNVLDNRRLMTETDWRPEVALREGVLRVAQWMRERAAGM